jgi:sugar phosphate isomerase/epimerase
MIRLCYTVATPDTADASMLALRGPLDHSFSLLSQHDYLAAELMVRDPSELNATEILRMAKDHGLALPAVSTGQLRKEDGLSLSATGERERTSAVDRTKHALDFAASLGAIVNIGTLRGQLPSDNAQREAALAAAKLSFEAILQHAHNVGVTVAIEPQCRYVVNWLNTAAETHAWSQQFEPYGPRILFDLYHAMLEEVSVHASLVRYFGDIVWLQVSDTNRRAPGFGHWNFPETFRLLDALGYTGFVSVECLQDPDSVTVLQQGTRLSNPPPGD